MHPRISVNAISSYKWTLDEDLAFYREIGAKHVGLMLSKLADDFEGAAGKIREAGLRVSCVSTSLNEISVIDVLREGSNAVIDRLKPAIDAAARLDCPICYFLSGATPPRATTDEALDALIETLKPAVAYATDKGVRLAIENNSVATRHHGFVNTMSDAARLAREADIDLDVELQNCWYEGNLAAFFRENVALIGLVQVSDFTLRDPLMFNRTVPGDGDMPLEWLIGALLDAGYGGAFDIEILGPRIEEEGYASAIRRSVDWLDDVLVRLGA